MHRLKTFLLTLAVAASAFAQPQPGARYTVGLRYKVDPSKRSEYIEFIKSTNTKVMKEWLKTNPKLVGWAVHEVSYGGSPMLDYNFITNLSYDGPPPENDRATFEAALKNVGMTWDSYQAKARSLRTLVGQHLRRSVATAGDGPGGDYSVVSYYKAAPGRLADCLESIRTVSQPVYSSMKNDGVVAGWGVSEVVFPRGQSQPFDLLAAASYKTFAEAVEASGGNRFSKYFAKVHPGKNYIGFIDFFRASRTLVRTDLIHRLASVNRQ